MAIHPESWLYWNRTLPGFSRIELTPGSRFLRAEPPPGSRFLRTEPIPGSEFPRTEPTQVEDSGDQIPKEPAGKRRKKRWILQEHTGSHWIMETVFRPENFWIFSGAFRSLSCAFPPETGRKSPEKNRNFLAGILLP